MLSRAAPAEPRPPAAGAGDFVELFSLHGRRDVEGRPLGEQRASPACREAVPTELVPCPYPGLRHRHARPMNRTALRQMTTHWDDIVGGLDDLRGRYIGRAGASTMTLDHLWRLSIAVVALPAYLLHRVARPLRDGEIPVAVGALYKAVLGIKAVIEGMILDAILAGRTSLERPTVADVHRCAETRALLIGPREVCAGPPRLIDDAIAALLGLGPAPESGGGVVVQHLGGGDEWLDFAGESCRLLFVLLAFATEATVLDQRDAVVGPERPDPDFTGYPEQQLSLTLGLRYLARPLAGLAAESRRSAWGRLAALLAVDDVRRDVEALVPSDRTRRLDPLAAYARLEADVGALLDRANAGLHRALGRSAAAPVDRAALIGYCGNRVSARARARRPE